MKIFRSIKISRRTLLAHKVRTLLALVGIIVGVAAVIIMVAIGSGAQRQVLNQIEGMGTNLLIVNAGQVKTFAGRKRQIGNVTTLTLRDSKAIVSECPSVNLAAPAQSKKLKVKYGNLSTNTLIVGTTPDFQDIRNSHVREGSFFTDEEDRASLRVAVLGQTVVENLFEGDDPMGETIRIGKVPFEVIGVMEKKGVDFNGVDQDDQILIPLHTALRRLFNITYINTIYIQAEGSKTMEQAVLEVTELLRQRHRLDHRAKPNDFTIQNQADLLKTKKETTETFTMLIGSIAAISLLVGGVGILAIMLIAVRERTYEIGLRMAVGARHKDILTQFLLEASMLSLTGGIVGIALGIVGAFIVGMATQWATRVSLNSLLLPFFFSLTIGLFFGVYPARKASLLDPIEALRGE